MEALAEPTLEIEVGAIVVVALMMEITVLINVVLTTAPDVVEDEPEAKKPVAVGPGAKSMDVVAL